MTMTPAEALTQARETGNNMHGPWKQGDALSEAQISSLRKLGFAIVPIDPTERMLSVCAQLLDRLRALGFELVPIKPDDAAIERVARAVKAVDQETRGIDRCGPEFGLSKARAAYAAVVRET